MSSIDLRTIPAAMPSMCIPRVFKNITRERVANVLRDLNLGAIDHIDMISRTSEKGDSFQRVFIHFKHWFSNPNADKARTMLLSGKEIKIIYDDPWFWKISANRNVSSQVRGSGDRPVLNFDDSPKRGRPTKKEFVPRSPSSSPPPSTPVSVLALPPKKRRVIKKPLPSAADTNAGTDAGTDAVAVAEEKEEGEM